MVGNMELFSQERWPQIAALAKAIGVNDWQAKKWRARRRIPPAWHLSLLAEARRQRVRLTAEELMEFRPRQRVGRPA